MDLQYLLRLIVLSFIFFNSVACAKDTAEAPQYLQVSPLEIVTQSGRYRFNVEVARTPDEIKKGLMFRKDISSSSGMLFIFSIPQEGRFWMKNTPLSLDVIFIDLKGKIAEFYENATPYSLKSMTSRGQKVKAVLEVLAGTCKRLHLRRGDKVVYPAFVSGN